MPTKRSTDEVIKWFYPSITKSILNDSIAWATQYTNIPQSDINAILHARKSLQFKDGGPQQIRDNPNRVESATAAWGPCDLSSSHKTQRSLPAQECIVGNLMKPDLDGKCLVPEIVQRAASDTAQCTAQACVVDHARQDPIITLNLSANKDTQLKLII